ncbi:alpha/beta hydrolase [Oculatella sp. LEGE 06141]|uniref:alpha/beta fold hydrolase n=1 Tax=Oculatella sp. LEGE 06141 TaxID=1828648 RepID=UPI00187F26AD|nr:alpha/beta hydrolase [Oculatella sp. LEGE 06141]MBE9177639.1 alpha/beta hydrolase [Oculatella sp. LEGE 06141]
MTAISSGWQHRFIETNRIRLHYVTQGEGDLVILLHGFAEFWYSWRYQIPALARHFKVVVPDLRGYNDSDKPTSGYDLDTLSTDIQGLIENLGYLKAHVVGHDWGGTIAWHLAHKFPTSLNRLAILNAPHPHRFLQELFGNLDQLRRSWYLLAFQVPGLPEWIIRHNLSSFVRTLFQEQAVRKGAFSNRDTEIFQAALEKPGVIPAALSYYRQLSTPQLWLRYWGRQPNPVQSPTLVLWGEEDALLSHNLTEGTEQFVDAPFQIKFVPHCGHWLQQEAPQTINRELLHFLRQA